MFEVALDLVIASAEGHVVVGAGHQLLLILAERPSAIVGVFGSLAVHPTRTRVGIRGGYFEFVATTDTIPSTPALPFGPTVWMAHTPFGS